MKKDPNRVLFLKMASFGVPEYGQGDWNHQQRRQRCLQAKTEAHALALRVQMLLKPLNDRKAAEYAENHRRCQNAMRVAALCGKFAGMFSCDEKGFRPTSITEVSTLKLPVINNGSKFKMEQCALQAAKEG